MRPRHRYLVALVISGQHAFEIDGLRRALSSRDLLRIAPHITVVPPVNVGDTDVDEVVELLRRIAKETSPILVELGPPDMFDDRDDVAFLRVKGAVTEIEQLQERLSVGPFAPPATRSIRPFVPHVTLASHLEPDLAKAAYRTLDGFAVDHEFGGIALLEQDITASDRPWRVITEFLFGSTAVVGRGGREIEFSYSTQLDPAAAQFFDEEWTRYLAEMYGADAAFNEPFALVARSDGQVVAVSTGNVSGTTWELDRLIVAPNRRKEGIGSQLLRRIELAASEYGATRIRLKTNAHGRAREFYHAHGYVVTSQLANWREGRAFVVMEREIVPRKAND